MISTGCQEVAMTKVKVSPKDEFLLPKAVMDAHGFVDGAEVEVSGGANQIVLRVVEKAAKSPDPGQTLTIEEFIERIPRYTGPPITDEAIDEAIAEGARQRWAKANRRPDEDSRS
jgi:hypothetical protein